MPSLMLLPTTLRGFADSFAGHVIGSLPLFMVSSHVRSLMPRHDSRHGWRIAHR
jgi:hypothetical protein